MSGLRDEDYIAFLEESGKQSSQGSPALWVVSGLFLPARLVRGAERRWRDFIKDHLGSRSGRREVKSKDLLAGRKGALQAQSTLRAKGFPPMSAAPAGHYFYGEALEHIASITELRVLTVGLHVKANVDAYRLWFWLANALLVEKPAAPRPRLALTVLDGRDTSLRTAQDIVAYRFYRAFPRCQPYVGAGKRWFVGGSTLNDGALHPVVQMADLVAGAARLAILGDGPEALWYRQKLIQPAQRMGRRIDVSSHARSQIRERSREVCLWQRLERRSTRSLASPSVAVCSRPRGGAGPRCCAPEPESLQARRAHRSLGRCLLAASSARWA